MSVTFSSVSSPSALKATKAANNIAYAQFGSTHDTVSVRFGSGDTNKRVESSDEAADKKSRFANYFKMSRNEEGKRTAGYIAGQLLNPINIKNVYQNIVYAVVLALLAPLTAGISLLAAPFVPVVGFLLQMLSPKAMGPKALEETKTEETPDANTETLLNNLTELTTKDPNFQSQMAADVGNAIRENNLPEYFNAAHAALANPLKAETLAGIVAAANTHNATIANAPQYELKADNTIAVKVAAAEPPTAAEVLKTSLADAKILDTDVAESIVISMTDSTQQPLDALIAHYKKEGKNFSDAALGTIATAANAYNASVNNATQYEVKDNTIVIKEAGTTGGKK
jgi:hypothetical protein